MGCTGYASPKLNIKRLEQADDVSETKDSECATKSTVSTACTSVLPKRCVRWSDQTDDMSDTEDSACASESTVNRKCTTVQAIASGVPNSRYATKSSFVLSLVFFPWQGGGMEPCSVKELSVSGGLVTWVVVVVFGLS